LNDTQTQLTQTQKDLNQARLAVAESLKEIAATRDEKAAIDAFHALHWDEAVSLFDRALATDPGNVYVEDMRAYMLFRLGKIDEALAQERQAIASDPNYATSYLNLARFQCAATPAQMDEARKNTEKFKAMRPDMSTFPKMDGEFQRVCKGQIQ
jgi:tetratricopeptide (TPR) repeat protein